MIMFSQIIERKINGVKCWALGGIRICCAGLVGGENRLLSESSPAS